MPSGGSPVSVGRNAVLVVNREGFAPVALAGEYRIAHPVLDLSTPAVHLFQTVDHLAHRRGIIIALDKVVEINAVLSGVGLLRNILVLDDGQDRYPEMLGESIVARIPGRDSHHRTRTVTGQDIIADVDRDVLPGERMHGIRPGKYPADASYVGHPLALGTHGSLPDVLLHLLALLGRSDLLDQRMLGCQGHKGDTEDRIGTRGEDFEFFVRTGHIEPDRRPFRTTDPVTLGFLDGFRPVDRIQTIQQTLGIGRDAHAPLEHVFPLYREPSAFGKPVLDLIVGQHRTQPGAPVHHRLAQVSQTVLREDLVAGAFVEPFPLLGCKERYIVVACRLDRTVAFFLEDGLQIANGTRFVGGVIVPRIVQLHKDPLCPAVILRVAGAHLAIPVERKPDQVQLRTVTLDVLLGSDRRMLPGLDGVLLGRQPERIVSHGMQHIETLVAFVAGVNIGCDVPQGVSHVQPGSRRIGEHVQHVILGQG